MNKYKENLEEVLDEILLTATKVLHEEGLSLKDTAKIVESAFSSILEDIKKTNKRIAELEGKNE